MRNKTGGATAPTRRAGLLPVILVVLVDLVGFGIVLPLLPFYAKDLGASAFQTGWLFSIYSIAQMFASPFWGRLSDRVGRRPVMLISTLGASAAYVTFAFSHTYALLFLSRLVAGLMGGNIAAAQAYVADVTKPEDRAKGMGLIGAAFGIGFAVGPAIAAILLQPFWGDWAAGFAPGVAATLKEDPYLFPGLFAAVMSCVSFLFVLLRLPESHHPGRVETPGASEAPVARAGSAAIWNVRFWKEFLAGGLGTKAILPMLWTGSWVLAFVQSSLYGAFPLFCQMRYGLTARGISSLYIVMGAVAVIVQGGAIRMLVKRFSESALFLAGAVCLVAAFMAMPWMGSFKGFAAMLALMTLGASLCGPTLSSLVSKEAGSGATGEALGRAQGMAGLGRAMGPSWGGWLYDRGPIFPFVITGVFAVQAVAMGVRLRSRQAASRKMKESRS